MPHFSSCCGADEYICQECGSIFCSKCTPSKWFKIFRVGGQFAGNVCLNCTKLLHRNEKEAH